MLMGSLSGLVNSTEQICFDYEVQGSAVSSISTGNILNGDEDGWYTIIVRHISGQASGFIRMAFNDDTGNNYGYRSIDASLTSVTDFAQTGQPSINISGGYTYAAGVTTFCVSKIYAKSGAVRMVNTTSAITISGTHVGTILPQGGVWNNTADNLTQMRFVSSTGGLGVGTRIIILKSNNFTNGTPTGSITTPYIKGSWVRVGSQVLGSAASSVTFSGLDGDRDVLYYLSVASKSGGNGYYSIQVNSDSGTNYGYQYLDASNTIVGASRATFNGFLGYTAATNGYGTNQHLIFAKQGFVRPSIYTGAVYISGTTIGNAVVHGQVYSTTNTNITQLALVSDANNFAAGSQFDLYALRPNG